MKKRILSILLLCCMVLTLLPTAAFAAGELPDVKLSVPTTFDKTVDLTKQNGELKIKDSKTYLIKGSTDPNWYFQHRIKIDGKNNTPHIFLDGVRLQAPEDGPAIELYGGASACLYFIGGDSELIGAENFAALQKNKTDGYLRVLVQTGTKLTCQGGRYGAGIGGSKVGIKNFSQGHGMNLHFGSLATGIYGGEILATSGVYGAGIGGGQGGVGEWIYVYSGKLTVRSVSEGAGIGGGQGGPGRFIYIKGGTVNAGSESGGAGIGSGDQDGQNKSEDAYHIEISGGTVEAWSNYAGAGIGGGRNGSGRDISITGGVVRAQGYLGAGIGGGMNGDSGNILIKDTTLTALAFPLYQDYGYTELSASAVGRGSNRAYYMAVMQDQEFAMTIEENIKIGASDGKSVQLSATGWQWRHNQEPYKKYWGTTTELLIPNENGRVDLQRLSLPYAYNYGRVISKLELRCEESTCSHELGWTDRDGCHIWACVKCGARDPAAEMSKQNAKHIPGDWSKQKQLCTVCGYVMGTDTKAPVLEGLKNGESYTIEDDIDGNPGAYTFTVSDPAESGETSSGIKSVTINGVPQTGPIYRLPAPDGGNNDAGAEHTVVATDNAGNETTATVRTYRLHHVKVISPDGNGTASASPDKAVAGTEITLTATPKEDYRFKEWQVVSPAGLVITNNKFTMPDSNVEVKAIFEEDAPPAPTEFTITVKTDGNGTASASLAKAAAGTEITLTATPNEGYHLKEWEVISGGVTIKDDKFIMPSANVEVKAIFEEDAPPAPTDPAKPSISVTGTYTYNGSEHTATVSGYDPATMDISGNTATDAGDYTVRVTSKTGKWADGSTEAVTAAWSIGKATQEAPNGLIGVAPTTVGGSDGKITGVDATMEYRAESETIYTACTGIEIENLSAGNYFVRYAGDHNHFASPDAEVTVGEGKPLADFTITFNGNGGSGSMGPVIVKAETNYILPACGFTAPADQEFKAWQIGGTEYKVGDSYTVRGDTEIKALWENSVITPTTYTVTVGNDGNGTGTASPSTAAAGTTIILTAMPKEGYHFKEWQVISGGVTIKNNKFTMPDNNVEVKAIFEEDTPPAPTEHTVTVTSGGNGTASASPAKAAAGAEITLSAAPDKGYHLKEWQVESPAGLVITNNKFTMPDTNVAIKAIFEEDAPPAPTEFTITVKTDGNGTASASHAKAVVGTEITLTAKPNKGYHFKEWEVISGGVTIKNNKFIMPSANVEVKAIFEEDTPPAPTEHTVTVTSGGNGTASASPAKAVAGAEITLSATPDKGYHLKEWQVESPAGLVITNNKFTMPDTNVAIKAIFEEDATPAPTEFTITVKTDGNGTASASHAKAVVGTGITLTAKPNKGYHFKEWEVISGGVTIKNNKFIMPDNNVEVKAIFEEDTPPAPTEHTVTVTSGGNGTASASPAKAVAGAEITLSATPDKGYHLKEWQVESPAGLVITNNKFTMPDTNVAIKAIFEEDAPPAPTEFTITVKTDGNGTASASHAKAVVGTEITLIAKPNKGYHFKEWEVISGGVTIKNNKFIMPSANVEVKAIFEEDVPALQYKDADKTTPAPAATATPAPAATATPQYTIPQTGDTSNPALLVVLMLVSGSAAIGTAVVASKKKHNR
ncbi:InlB B-repeat-containing protein [Gemmiger formicilis]|uniref:InlB B-repeat-containing protein n=1 Tax=Gemmiger formicilis TaxID=745368 RepID=UPI003521DE03